VDKVKSRSGNNLLDICKANNLFIVNGRIGDDKTESGKLTCKNASVVDYCMNIITIITSRLITPRDKFKFEICNSWRVNIRIQTTKI
jgi:hypothetical protein